MTDEHSDLFYYNIIIAVAARSAATHPGTAERACVKGPSGLAGLCEVTVPSYYLPLML